jgi:hypothetical protein
MLGGLDIHRPIPGPFEYGPEDVNLSLVASLHPNARRTRYSAAGEAESASNMATMATETRSAGPIQRISGSKNN